MNKKIKSKIAYINKLKMFYPDWMLIIDVATEICLHTNLLHWMYSEINDDENMEKYANQYYKIYDDVMHSSRFTESEKMKFIRSLD